jgi:hypothetical protein
MADLTELLGQFQQVGFIAIYREQGRQVGPVFI